MVAEQNKFVLFLKRRSSDIILVIAAVLVFFLAGKKNDKTELAEQLQSMPPKIESNAQTIKDSEVPRTDPPVPINAPPVPETVVSESKMFHAQAAINSSTGSKVVEENLTESLKKLGTAQPSVKDLSNRNSYFQKRTEQLNQLQGNAPTDSSREREKADQFPFDHDILENNISFQAEEALPLEGLEVPQK